MPNISKFKFFSQQGFTILEILIVIALIGVVSIPLGAALTMGLQTFQTESGNMTLEQDQRAAISWIEELCRTYPDEVTLDEATNQLEVHGRTFHVNASNELTETASATTRVMCESVSVFDFSDVTRNEALKLLGFTLIMETQSPTNTNKIITSIALKRY